MAEKKLPRSVSHCTGCRRGPQQGTPHSLNPAACSLRADSPCSSLNCWCMPISIHVLVNPFNSKDQSYEKNHPKPTASKSMSCLHAWWKERWGPGHKLQKLEAVRKPHAQQWRADTATGFWANKHDRVFMVTQNIPQRQQESKYCANSTFQDIMSLI